MKKIHYIEPSRYWTACRKFNYVVGPEFDQRFTEEPDKTTCQCCIDEIRKKKERFG